MKVYSVMVVSHNMLSWRLPKIHKLFKTRKLANEYVKKKQSSNKTRNEYYVGKSFMVED